MDLISSTPMNTLSSCCFSSTALLPIRLAFLVVTFPIADAAPDPADVPVEESESPLSLITLPAAESPDTVDGAVADRRSSYISI